MRAVLIIGAGLAGLSAAITLAEGGRKSVLISALPAERAQSVMAEGGINAALDTYGQGDSPEQHFEDTMAAGCGLADPNAVRAMTAEAPEIVEKLAKLGVAFNRTAEGKLDQRYFGGQEKRRTVFAQSSTGKQVTAALIQRARYWESRGMIERRDHHALLDLVMTEDGACAGCILRDGHSGETGVCLGPVLLCCGGLNGLFGKTTGTVQNTGGAAAAAFAAGVPCANLEMIQYHPTTAAISGKRALISEAARGEGGRLFLLRGDAPWYYMEELYPKFGSLMPRDVVSRETARLCREYGQETAWLDMTGITAGAFEEKLADLRAFCREFLHLDPKTAPIPVYPGIHYFMGGLYVDALHRTPARHLYAAGECACQYHGANRLGGNSLLGALRGGRQAARTILAGETEDDVLSPPEQAAAQWRQKLREIEGRCGACSCAAGEQCLAQTMRAALGIERSEETLRAGAEALAALAEELRRGRDSRVRPEEQLALERRVDLAAAMTESARERKESRGAHWRRDFPERRDADFQKTTLACRRDGKTEIAFAEIPKEEST